MNGTYVPSGSERDVPDTIPAVTVFSKPKGEPIASTHSPTRILDGSPSFTVGRSFASIFTTATSVSRSTPATLPLNSRRSESLTFTSSAPSTTCALVSTTPSAWTMKPEPMPCSGMRGIGPGPWPGPWNRRKNSLSGLSSSSSPPAPGFPPKGICACGETTFVAVMLTTAPLFASTITAKSGSVCVAPPAACAPACCAGAVAPAAGTLTLAGDALALTGSSLEQPLVSNAAAATANSTTLAFTGPPSGIRLRARSGGASCAVSSRDAPRSAARPVQWRRAGNFVRRRCFLEHCAERTAHCQRSEHHPVPQIFREQDETVLQLRGGDDQAVPPRDLISPADFAGAYSSSPRVCSRSTSPM